MNSTVSRVYFTGTQRMQKKRTMPVLTWRNVMLSLLVIVSLLSAFGVIYLKDLNRRLFINVQKLQQVEQQTRVEKSKLLLEQSTWTTQERIQRIAQHQLGMVTPTAKNMVMVEEMDETFASR